MGTKIQLTHADFVAFLRGEGGDELDRKVAQLREDSPEYEMLFGMAEEIRQSEGIVEPQGNNNLVFKKVTPGDIDDLLADIYTGTADQERKQLFLDQLFVSDLFYDLLLRNFAETNEVLQAAVKLAASGEQLGSKSNTALLKKASILKPQPIPTPAPQSGWWEDIQTLAKQLFSGGSIRYASAAVAFAVVLFGIVTPTWIASTNPFNKPNWDNDMPYAFEARHRGAIGIDPGGIRNPGLNPEMAKTWTNLLTKMKSRMENYIETPYIEKDYDAVLKSAIELKPTAEELEGLISAAFQPPAEDDSTRKRVEQLAAAKEMVQNFYFYTGVSSLAIFRTETRDISEADRQKSLEIALQWLSKAKELGIKYQKTSLDREHYFLGLALAYEYKNDAAVREFNAVSQSSTLYEKAIAFKSWLTDN